MTDDADHSPEHIFDAAVVGAGPIGIELAVALKRAGIDYVQFDAKQIGYTISWFAPGTRFFSSNERIAIAGVPLQTVDQGKATREQYLAYLRQIVSMYDLQVHTYEPAMGIERDGELQRLTSNHRGNQRTTLCRNIILCTGGTDRPRMLNVPGENLPHVSHYFHDPHTYFRKRLLVVGGKNSAVEAALRCHHAGAHVTLSYRRSQLNPTSIKYWLLPEINGLIASGQITGLFDSHLTQITPNEVEFEGRPPFRLPFDFVLLMTGYEADLSLLRLAGVELQGSCELPMFDERTMQSNAPGVYVAGCAIGGTQDKYSVFLENCHVHVPRIVSAIRGDAPVEVSAPEYARPET